MGKRNKKRGRYHIELELLPMNKIDIIECPKKYNLNNEKHQNANSRLTTYFND